MGYYKIYIIVMNNIVITRHSIKVKNIEILRNQTRGTIKTQTPKDKTAT